MSSTKRSEISGRPRMGPPRRRCPVASQKQGMWLNADQQSRVSQWLMDIRSRGCRWRRKDDARLRSAPGYLNSLDYSL